MASRSCCGLRKKKNSNSNHQREEEKSKMQTTEAQPQNQQMGRLSFSSQMSREDEEMARSALSAFRAKEDEIDKAQMGRVEEETRRLANIPEVRRPLAVVHEPSSTQCASTIARPYYLTRFAGCLSRPSKVNPSENYHQPVDEIASRLNHSNGGFDNMFDDRDSHARRHGENFKRRSPDPRPRARARSDEDVLSDLDNTIWDSEDEKVAPANYISSSDEDEDVNRTKLASKEPRFRNNSSRDGINNLKNKSGKQRDEDWDCD